MVRLAGFAAINQDLDSEQDALQQTLEAQEANVIEQYELALRDIKLGNTSEAEVSVSDFYVFYVPNEILELVPSRQTICSPLLQSRFIQILEDKLVVTGATEQLQRIRFLCLKNLGGVVALTTSRSREALDLFRQATDTDSSDIALWDRYGTLAAQMGEWTIAKAALQQALMIEPRHPTLGEKLLQLLLHVGDCAGARTFANAYLKQIPSHPLSQWVVSKGLDTPPSTIEGRLCGVRMGLPLMAHDTPPSVSLFSSQPPMTASLKQPTWEEILTRCAEILEDPDTTSARVRFELVLPTEDPAQHGDPEVAPAAIQTLPTSTEQTIAVPEVPLPEQEAPARESSIQEPRGDAACAMDTDAAGDDVEAGPKEERDDTPKLLPVRSTRWGTDQFTYTYTMHCLVLLISAAPITALACGGCSQTHLSSLQ